MKNKIELILPAGNWDSLKAAVENGADAVYVGVGNFNARRRADNFLLKDFQEVTDYCHENGVKVYCTMNILVKNDEIQSFFETIKELYLKNIDAVIIQELSFLPIIKHNFPDLEVHISTQAGIFNSYFYDLIKDADKIVLPREFSKEQIKSFIKKTSLPTEIFVQGAQCFSYSGKCLFSSLLGGRSGNRGLCAQPCRKKYNGKYLLSMKDLSLLKEIPELIKMGVSTLKIEGRLRSPKYVAAAAKAYRYAIDSYYAGKEVYDEEFFREMKLAFNRKFTWGHYNGTNDKVIASDKPMGRGLFLGTMGKDKMIKLEEDLYLGDGLGIWLKDKVDGAVLKKMEKDGEEVDFAKTGEVVKIHIRAKEGINIYKTSSVKESKPINFVRNKSVAIKKRKVNEIILPTIISQKSSHEELLIKVNSKIDADDALSTGVKKVFYNIFEKDFSKKYSAYIPRILNDYDVEDVLELIEMYHPKNILIGDLGAYCSIKKKYATEIKKGTLKLYLDYSNNVFNDIDLEFFNGAIPIISPELNFKELQKFENKNFAVMVHGKIVLMNTKYSKLPNKLRDQKKYIFPVKREHDYYQILNSKELGLFDKVNDFQKEGIKLFFLDLDSSIVKKIKIYQSLIKGKNTKFSPFGYTKGNFEVELI